MSGQDFAAAVEECLQRLDRGQNLPDVLVDFPDMAENLEPLLLVAMASRAFPVPVPCQTALRLSRNQMLAEMAELEARGAFRKEPSPPRINRLVSYLAGTLWNLGFNKLAYSYRLAMVSLVLILSGGLLTLSASASSQPGSILSTLKMSMERVGLVWMINDRDQDQDGAVPELPGKSAVRSERSIEVLTGIDVMLTGPEDQSTNPPENAKPNAQLTSDDALKSADKELAAAARAAEKALRDQEQAAAEAAREAEQALKSADKAAAAETREEEKTAAAQEREAEKQLKDQDKAAVQQPKNDQQPTGKPSTGQSKKNPIDNNSGGDSSNANGKNKSK